MTDTKPPSEGSGQQNEKWYKRTRYQVLLFGIGIALFIIVGGWILDWYINPHTSGQKKDLVQALGLLTAGVAGAVGIFFTWRGQTQAREAQEENQENTLAQLENARKQLELARQSQEENQENTQAQMEQAREELDITRRGQMTERFTQAIEQLGSEKLDIRLGGIYSLERTAQEEQNYHWPVMEVLISYVRRHAFRQPDDAVHVVPEDVSPEPDVQAILTVIGRRSVYHKDVELGPIDLHDMNLQGADFRDAKLAGSNLEEADLREANFPEANLQGANLHKANLHRFREEPGVWYGNGADFYQANLEEANLFEADLQGAYLEGANLEKASCAEANLLGVVLRRANLKGTYLRATNLRAANLIAANLEGANLEGANLEEGELQGANLEGAENLVQAQLKETSGDEYTLLPRHLKPPAHWGVNADEEHPEA